VAVSTRNPFFATPIEIAGNGQVTINGTVYTLAPGVWANLTSVLYALRAAIIDKNGGGAIYCRLPRTDSQSLLLLVYCAPVTTSFTWGDASLRDALGFAGNLSGSTAYNSAYTPPSIWYPGRADASGDDWHEVRQAVGALGQSGAWTAVATSDVLARKRFRFPAVAGTRVLRSLGTTTYEQERSWEAFVARARASAPSAAGRPPTTGVWYVDSGLYYDKPDSYWTWEQTPTAGGTDFALSSSPDRYAFCSIPTEPPDPARFLTLQSDYLDVEFELQTAPLPPGGFTYGVSGGGL